MGSSLSWPVSCSIKPEPRPLIWILQLASCWMCLTLTPWCPTTWARRLKPGMSSRLIGIFSSGHFLCQSSVCWKRKKKFCIHLPFRGDHAQQAQLHEDGETYVHQQGLEVLVSSALQSWQWQLQGPLLSYGWRGGEVEDSGFVRWYCIVKTMNNLRLVWPWTYPVCTRPL